MYQALARTVAMLRTEPLVVVQSALVGDPKILLSVILEGTAKGGNSV